MLQLPRVRYLPKCGPKVEGRLGEIDLPQYILLINQSSLAVTIEFVVRLVNCGSFEVNSQAEY